LVLIAALFIRGFKQSRTRAKNARAYFLKLTEKDLQLSEDARDLLNLWAEDGWVRVSDASAEA